MKTSKEWISDIHQKADEQLVYRRKRKKAVIGISSSLACLGIIMVSVFTLQGINGKNTSYVGSYRNDIIIKHLPVSKPSENTPDNSLDWDLMTNTQRFGSLKLNNAEYTARDLAVHTENEGDFLGTVTISSAYIKNGKNTDEIRTAEVKVYAIKGIQPIAAVAVQFSETNECSYAYVNSFYTPKTLGDFISDVNLKENLKTELCYFYSNETENDIVVYEDVPTSVVWDKLLNDMTVVNEPDKQVGSELMSISAKIDVLGYSNMTVSLTKDGYLWTNLLDTGKYFYIGEEKIKAFVNEIITTHQGYRYVYDLISDGEPEGHN